MIHLGISLGRLVVEGLGPESFRGLFGSPPGRAVSSCRKWALGEFMSTAPISSPKRSFIFLEWDGSRR